VLEPRPLVNAESSDRWPQVEEHQENSQRRVHLRNLYKEAAFLTARCDDNEPGWCALVLAEAEAATDAMRTWEVRCLGDVKSSLSDAKSSLGDAESSLGDAKSSLG
jgi:hypothetical protein